MEKLQIDAGDKWSREQAAIDKRQQYKSNNREKSSDVTALLQKDQSGLKKAKQAYIGSLASRQLQALNPEITDVNRIEVGQKINLPGQLEPYMVKKGDTLDKIASRAKTSAMQSVAATNSQPSFITKDFGNAQRLTLDPGEEIVDVPTVIGTGNNKFKASSAEPELPASSEIKKAMQDFEREQALADVDDDITTINPRLNAPGQNIDWKTIAPELFDTDKDNKVLSTATFKESINTKSNAELHDILRLAGRK
jgi:LysM repeat protein